MALWQQKFCDLLASIEPASRLSFAGPAGYFTFRPSARRAVFVATGTGIAPFVSMIRAGVVRFNLLHGVRRPSELYYRSLFRNAGQPYFPCLSATVSRSKAPENSFHGRVTDCLKRHFPADTYDFYLCGRKEMIRDVTFLIDDCFPGSYVYTEIFY
jgi:benzoate/toluate 1,2-dioxygenase reductase subunit